MVPLSTRNFLFNLGRSKKNEVEVIHKIIEIDEHAPTTAKHSSRTPKDSYLKGGVQSVLLKSIRGATLISPSIKILRGRYDVTSFRVFSKDNKETYDTLELSSTIPEEANSSYSSLLNIDVEYRYSWFNLIARIAIAIITLLTFLGINFYSELESVVPPALQKILEPFSVVIFILAVKSLWDEASNILKR